MQVATNEKDKLQFLAIISAIPGKNSYHPYKKLSEFYKFSYHFYKCYGITEKSYDGTQQGYGVFLGGMGEYL